MNNNHSNQMKRKPLSNFKEPESLSFYSSVINKIETISNEFMNDSFELSLLKIRVGYERTWHNTITEVDDLPPPIERWIIEGGFHEQQIGYDSRDGEWNTFPLYKKDDPQLSEAISKFMPKTITLLKQIPNLHFAAIFKQPPLASVKPHAHSIKHHICHFLLADLVSGSAWIQVNEVRKHLKKKGDCIVFDYSQIHSSSNESDSDRINLVLDVIV